MKILEEIFYAFESMCLEFKTIFLSLDCKLNEEMNDIFQDEEVEEEHKTPQKKIKFKD